MPTSLASPRSTRRCQPRPGIAGVQHRRRMRCTFRVMPQYVSLARHALIAFLSAPSPGCRPMSGGRWGRGSCLASDPTAGPRRLRTLVVHDVRPWFRCGARSPSLTNRASSATLDVTSPPRIRVGASLQLYVRTTYGNRSRRGTARMGVRRTLGSTLTVPCGQASTSVRVFGNRSATYRVPFSSCPLPRHPGGQSLGGLVQTSLVPGRAT
jgi:hypothetical protein